MKLRLLNTTDHNPWYNLAVENAALERLAEDEVLLYLWQNENTVVIGRGQNPWRECRVHLLDKEGGSLARRSSGGGAVFHDLGNLNFSFIAGTPHYDLSRQLAVIVEACRSLGIEAEFSGRNDILVGDAKFSGNAFRHLPGASLHHGTLLVNVDMQKLGRYLLPSEAKLRSKGVQSVRSRVCNLTQYAPSLTPDDMRLRMADAFGKIYGSYREESLEEWGLTAQNRVHQLYLKYSSWDWRFGETIDFQSSMETRFDWGGIALDCRLEGGQVVQVYVDTDAMDADMAERLERILVGCHYGGDMVRHMEAAALREEGATRVQLEEIARWLEEVV